MVKAPGEVVTFCGVPGVVRGVADTAVPYKPNAASGEAAIPEATETEYSVPFVRPDTVPVQTVAHADDAATVCEIVVPPFTAFTR
jgi:hypothetical protein